MIRYMVWWITFIAAPLLRYVYSVSLNLRWNMSANIYSCAKYFILFSNLCTHAIYGNYSGVWSRVMLYKYVKDSHFLFANFCTLYKRMQFVSCILQTTILTGISNILRCLVKNVIYLSCLYEKTNPWYNQWHSFPRKQIFIYQPDNHWYELFANLKRRGKPLTLTGPFQCRSN